MIESFLYTFGQRTSCRSSKPSMTGSHKIVGSMQAATELGSAVTRVKCKLGMSDVCN